MRIGLFIPCYIDAFFRRSASPRHVVVPAVHKLRTDVAQVFAKAIGTDPNNSDVHYLAEAQREANRPLGSHRGCRYDGLQLCCCRDRQRRRLHQ
jgi:hypothetical protein